METKSLKSAIQQALKEADLDVLGSSPLAALPIVARRSQELAAGTTLPQARGLAVQWLLAQALDAVAGQWPQEAQLLTERFMNKRSVLEVSTSFGIAEPTLHEWQRRALDRITRIVVEMNAAASETRGAWRRRLLADLPPPSYAGTLVGVERQVAQLCEWLGAGRGPTAPIIVTGLGGLGKTSLAREALDRWIASAQPEIERVLWATVVQYDSFQGRGGGEPGRLALDQVVLELGEKMGEPLAALAENERRLRHLARRLAEQPAVVVVDNVETPHELRIALTIAEALAAVAPVLITSRHQQSEGNVRPLVLHDLTSKDAHELLAQEATRLEIEQVLSGETSTRIFERVGGNPLALKLVVSQLARLPLRLVLDGLDGRATGMTAAFERIYDRAWGLLSEMAQDILLGILLLPPSAGATWEGLRLAAELERGAPCTNDELAAAVDELTRLNLLQTTVGAERSYSLHRLTFGYLARKNEMESDGEAT